MGLTDPLRVTVVVPVEPAEPVVADGAAVAPVVAPVFAPPPEPADEPTLEPLLVAADDDAGHPSAWSDARVDWAVWRLV